MCWGNNLHLALGSRLNHAPAPAVTASVSTSPSPQRDPLSRITRPGGGPSGEGAPTDKRSGEAAATAEGDDGRPAVVAKAADALGGLQAALALQPDDPWYVGGAKILGMILAGALVLGLSPLIILGLIAGLAAAA